MRLTGWRAYDVAIRLVSITAFTCSSGPVGIIDMHSLRESYSARSVAIGSSNANVRTTTVVYK